MYKFSIKMIQYEDLDYFWENGFQIRFRTPKAKVMVLDPEQQAFLYNLVVHKGMTEQQAAEMHFQWAQKYTNLRRLHVELIIRFINENSNAVKDEANSPLRAHWDMVMTKLDDRRTLQAPNRKTVPNPPDAYKKIEPEGPESYWRKYIWLRYEPTGPAAPTLDVGPWEFEVQPTGLLPQPPSSYQAGPGYVPPSAGFAPQPPSDYQAGLGYVPPSAGFPPLPPSVFVPGSGYVPPPSQPPQYELPEMYYYTTGTSSSSYPAQDNWQFPSTEQLSRQPRQSRYPEQSQTTAVSGRQRHPPRDPHQDTAVGRPRRGRSASPARERSPGSRERNYRRRTPLPVTPPNKYVRDLPKDLSPEERKRREDVETRKSNIWMEAIAESNVPDTAAFGLEEGPWDKARELVDQIHAEDEIETAKYEAATRGEQRLLEAGDQTQTQAQKGGKSSDLKQKSRQGEQQRPTERGRKEPSERRTQGDAKDKKKPSSGRSKR